MVAEHVVKEYKNLAYIHSNREKINYILFK